MNRDELTPKQKELDLLRLRAYKHMVDVWERDYWDDDEATWPPAAVAEAEIAKATYYIARFHWRQALGRRPDRADLKVNEFDPGHLTG